MKTILLFTKSSEQRKVVLKHDKDVHLSRENREENDYIVIRFPNGKANMKDFNLRPERYLSTGFTKHVFEKETELLFFDQSTFTWCLSDLANMGLFQVTQRHIPDEEDIFAYYINAKGVRQWGYNAIFMTLQFVKEKISKESKKKKELG